MGYNKLIISGNQYELYEYEKELTIRGRHRRDKIDPSGEDIRDSRSVSSFREESSKRRQDNSRRASMDFKRVVLANLRAVENPLLVSLTQKQNVTSLSISARFFKIFVQNMRAKYGKGFSYIAVPEFQKRGAVHYHVLFWGLPSFVARRERKTRAIAKIWGQGFIDVVETDGNEKLSGYLAKYMVKALEDPRLLNTKAYFASRNIQRPVKIKGAPAYWIEQEYGLSTMPVLQVKEYMTQWLGTGRYKRYQNK